MHNFSAPWHAMRQAVTRSKADATVDEAIHHAIEAAILHGRLPPGLRLGEHRLAAIFGVSRERIRKVLHRLAAERRLEIVRNRGARVPCPSEAEVRAIYEAHRVLEAGVLVQLGRLASPVLLDRLEGHLAEEREAARCGDRAASIRLSGDFHRHLVDALGNAELSRMLRDLLGRSSVMVTVYEPAHQSPCAVDEHGAIVAALRAGDLPGALQASRHHFLHVEERLRLMPPAGEAAVSLEAVFAACREPSDR